MLGMLKVKCENWLASDKKVKKLGVSLHYYLFRHRMWDRVLFLDTKSKFTEIYRNNLWNNEESRSGGGSTLSRTTNIRTGLQELLLELGVKSICDAGCGDFNWMKSVEMKNVDYIGVDIVSDLIAANKEKYQGGNIKFIDMDIICDDLPTVDLILCREVLFHLSFQDVSDAIRNFKRSGSKYLLATHYPYISENTEIQTGQCRGINFQKAPLEFPAPKRMIEENVSDHCLALWELAEIDPHMFWGRGRGVLHEK